MNVKLINFLDLFSKSVQYSVPKWQRRYSWNRSTIQQLIKDLEAISKLDKANARHFGGTLITYAEATPAGTAQIFHVVDGQQRLTTISILLACIAEKLAETGPTEQLSSEKITKFYLRNQLDPLRKLSLQDGDDEEYRRIIEGGVKGEGKVTAAWKILRSEVNSVGADCLMKGLSRFKVISFTCEPYDDPQQIFESLNATGVPLTEGEKVKNWLLMGLDKKTQDQLYQDYWRKLEQSLDALHEPKRIDEFLRDFLRWKTGEVHGINLTYANLRRWWYKTEGSKDRSSLCKEFARLSGLYGKITGANDHHENVEIDRSLQYLRGLGLDIHRPFTLRLLDDATKPDATGASGTELIRVLKSLCTWLTRLWLVNKGMSGLNTESAKFANHRIAEHEMSYADYWIWKINQLRHTNIAMPNEEEIMEGIRKRSAYGGKASDAAKTILWAINSQLSNAANPNVEDLSIEHIMPRKLSQAWWNYLGDDADELQRKYLNTLANLTLVGERLNSEISNQVYEEKRKLYGDSSVTLTRELSKSYMDWREEDIEDRVKGLTGLILNYWPWENASRAIARWRIHGGRWTETATYTDLLLNVAAGFIDADPERNSELLLAGNFKSGTYIYRSGSEPNGRFAPIPGYNGYIVSIGLWDRYKILACYEMAERCGIRVEIERLKELTEAQKIWEKVDPDRLYGNGETVLRWRVNRSGWLEEHTYPDLLLNVVAALMDLDPEGNGEQLLDMKYAHGGGTYFFRSKTKASSRCVLVPRHDTYKVNVGLMHKTIVKLCREMGEVCGTKVKVEILKNSDKGQPVWEYLDSEDPVLLS